MCHKIGSWFLYAVVLCLAMVAAQCEPVTALNDDQLSAVYAQGFDVTVDLGINVSATDPKSVVITGDQLNTLKDLLAQKTFQSGGTPLSRLPSLLDAGGNLNIPGISAIQNTLNITDHAMENAQSMLNVFAMNGDVAVGMNLNVIVNPGDTPFTVTQMNINWADLLLSGSMPTLPKL